VAQIGVSLDEAGGIKEGRGPVQRRAARNPPRSINPKTILGYFKFALSHKKLKGVKRRKKRGKNGRRIRLHFWGPAKVRQRLRGDFEINFTLRQAAAAPGKFPTSHLPLLLIRGCNTTFSTNAVHFTVEKKKFFPGSLERIKKKSLLLYKHSPNPINYSKY
jgi:hypothetical protein